MSASLNVMQSKVAGGVTDYLSGKKTSDTHYDEPPRNPAGALDEPSEVTGVSGVTHGTGGKEPK